MNPMSIEKMQEVMGKFTHRFHDMMEEAQEELGHGIPLNMLALFFSIEIKGICEKSPQFEQMLAEAIKYQKDKQSQLVN